MSNVFYDRHIHDLHSTICFSSFTVWWLKADEHFQSFPLRSLGAGILHAAFSSAQCFPKDFIQIFEVVLNIALMVCWWRDHKLLQKAIFGMSTVTAVLSSMLWKGHLGIQDLLVQTHIFIAKVCWAILQWFYSIFSKYAIHSFFVQWTSALKHFYGMCRFHLFLHTAHALKSMLCYVDSSHHQGRQEAQVLWMVSTALQESVHSMCAFSKEFPASSCSITRWYHWLLDTIYWEWCKFNSLCNQWALRPICWRPRQSNSFKQGLWWYRQEHIQGRKLCLSNSTLCSSQFSCLIAEQNLFDTYLYFGHGGIFCGPDGNLKYLKYVCEMRPFLISSFRSWLLLRRLHYSGGMHVYYYTQVGLGREGCFMTCPVFDLHFIGGICSI